MSSQDGANIDSDHLNFSFQFHHRHKSPWSNDLWRNTWVVEAWQMSEWFDLHALPLLICFMMQPSTFLERTFKGFRSHEPQSDDCDNETFFPVGTLTWSFLCYLFSFYSFKIRYLFKLHCIAKFTCITVLFHFACSSLQSYACSQMESENIWTFSLVYKSYIYI